MGTGKKPSHQVNIRSEPASHENAPPGVQLTDKKSKASVGLVTAFSACGVSAQHVRVNTQQGFTVGWQGHSYYVALHDLHSSDCEIFADDHAAARERDLRDRLAFVPSGCRAWGWMVPTLRPQSFTALFLDPASLDDELATRLRKLPQRARLYFFDEPLRSTLRKLRGCLIADTPPDSMYVESLCMLAAIELCRLPAPREGEPGVLGEQITGRVVDYIMQNLNKDISLKDLANVANLSRFHFLRAFKRATSETPYQHLLRRRIERAQELLRSDRMKIAEIASAVGFKNSNRLTTAFLRIMNCTPSAFRASIRR
jgi:AraC family transcriptional regulator